MGDSKSAVSYSWGRSSCMMNQVILPEAQPPVLADSIHSCTSNQLQYHCLVFRGFVQPPTLGYCCNASWCVDSRGKWSAETSNKPQTHGQATVMPAMPTRDQHIPWSNQQRGCATPLLGRLQTSWGDGKLLQTQPGISLPSWVTRCLTGQPPKKKNKATEA